MSKSKLDKFVGRKVNVNVTEHRYKDMVSKSVQLIDDKFKAEVGEAFPGTKVRYKMSGYMYTQDILMSRLNIQISDDGVITEVYYG